MRRIFLYIFLFIQCGILFSQGTDWTADDELKNRQIGLKLGIGEYTMFGGELQNPRLKTGFQAGFFWHGEKIDKRLNWQTGLEICLLGSNFNNKDSFGLMSSSTYSQLGIIQIEIPLMCNIRLRKNLDNRYESFQAGLIPAAIVNSVIYTGEDKVPAQQTNLKNWKNLPLNPFNLQASIAYQYRGGVVGYIVRVKASLLDLNQNFQLPGLLPATGTGKRIGTAGVEFALLF
ncbi:MAG: hypothetical protein KG003_12635 [Bacteroidetes bacterium]|nr:hypothetical protein [Bacteroidota bacterium]